MRDRAQDIQKNPDSRVYIERAPVAVFVDGLSLNMFEYKIRFSVLGDACIDEFRDVRMRQPAENAAFALESFRPLRGHGEIQKLNRHLALEAAVTPFRKPYAAHPSLPDRRKQFVSAYDSPRQRCLTRGSCGTAFEESLLCQRAVLVQQLLDEAGEIRPLPSK